MSIRSLHNPDAITKKTIRRMAVLGLVGMLLNVLFWGAVIIVVLKVAAPYLKAVDKKVRTELEMPE
jgi:hypothetical protein